MPLPLFGNKFSPKAAAPRKSPSLSNLSNDPAFREAELGIDYGPIKINLGNNEVTFEDGQWISETSGAASVHREMAKIQKENQVLQEENNLLKLKVEMLLDLLAETTAEVHLQENEIENLKAASNKNKR